MFQFPDICSIIFFHMEAPRNTPGALLLYWRRFIFLNNMEYCPGWFFMVSAKKLLHLHPLGCAKSNTVAKGLVTSQQLFSMIFFNRTLISCQPKKKTSPKQALIGCTRLSAHSRGNREGCLWPIYLN